MATKRITKKKKKESAVRVLSRMEKCQLAADHSGWKGLHITEPCLLIGVPPDGGGGGCGGTLYPFEERFKNYSKSTVWHHVPDYYSSESAVQWLVDRMHPVDQDVFAMLLMQRIARRRTDGEPGNIVASAINARAYDRFEVYGLMNHLWEA